MTWPVSLNGSAQAVLYEKDESATPKDLPVAGNVRLATEYRKGDTTVVLDALARGEGPEEAVVALGYAGWDAGQLEAEMAQNAWLTVPADERLLFATPVAERWQAAGRLLGVNLLHLSSEAGHA